MYKVIHISSGIVAVTFNDRQYALDWIADNNHLLNEYVNIYKLIKAKA
jgi:N-acetylglucosamine-6-phosphate deacetylase